MLITRDKAIKHGACATFLALSLPVLIASHVDEDADLMAPQTNVMTVSQKLTHSTDGRSNLIVPEGRWIVKGKVPNNTRIDVGCPTGETAEKTGSSITFSGPIGDDVSFHRCEGAFKDMEIRTTSIGNRFFLESTHGDFFCAGQIGSQATLLFNGDILIGSLENNAYVHSKSAYIISAQGIDAYTKFLRVGHLTAKNSLTVNSGKSTIVSFMDTDTNVIVSSGHLEIFNMAQKASVMVPADASWIHDVSIAVTREPEGGNVFATWQAKSYDKRLIPLTFYSRPNQAIVTGNFDVTALKGIGHSDVNVNGSLQIPNDDRNINPERVKAKGGIIKFQSQ